MKARIMLTGEETKAVTSSRQIIKLLMLTLVLMLSSCVKEGSVNYSFYICNATETPMTVRLSSWGNYTMYINNMYDSSHKFQAVESIKPYSSLMFSKDVGDHPNAWQIPSSLTPAWEYIESIECNGAVIPKEYFSNTQKWELNVANQINGTFTEIKLYITPELIEQFTQK